MSALRSTIRPPLPDQIVLEAQFGLTVVILPNGRCPNHEEDAVAKGQQRSNREKKKPKQDKKKVTAPATPIGLTDQRGKPGSKKRA